MAGNTEDDIIGGANTDDAESVLRKHLNSALAGPNWDALIYALSRGDQRNWDNAQSIFRQLNLSTATGDYLEQRALDQGVSKPTGLGIGDESFQKYAIKRSATQLTSQVLYEMMEVLYGSDAVRASITSITGTYNLSDGDDLILWIDKKKLVRVVFTPQDFSTISNASALEVATAITRACELNQSKAFAAAVTNVSTGAQSVRFYSQTLGPSSSVVVLGGKAQNALQFPTLLNLTFEATGEFSGIIYPHWDITYIPSTGRTRFTTRTDSSMTLILNGLQPGDYVNIYGSEFDPANQGSFEIQNVYYAYLTTLEATQYFEINLTGVNQTNVTQINGQSIMYFRRTYGNIFAGDRTVSIVQNKEKIKAVFPATSSAVSRELYTAAYTQSNPTQQIAQVARDGAGLVTVTTALSHGLSIGDQVVIDGVYSDITAPTATTADFTVPRTSYSPLSRTSEIEKNGWSWGSGSTSGTTVSTKDGKVAYIDNLSALSNVMLYSPVSSTTVSPGVVYYTFNVTNLTDIDSGLGAASLRDDGTTSGKAMYTGGQNSGGTILNTSYEFDGTTFTSRANMNTARGQHRQVTLDNSSYFVIGGTNGSIALSSCEKWTFDTWTAKASLNTARYSHQAIVLQNGKVLVIGGTSNGSNSLNSCEIYDPNANTWSFTGPMTWARNNFKAHLLSDGRVIAIGGIGYDPARNSSVLALNTCEIYDPSTGRWAPVNSMSTVRQNFCSELINNRIYVFGGQTDSVLLNSVFLASGEYLDLATFKWNPAPSLSRANSLGKSAITQNKILIMGGWDGISRVDKWQMFIPASDSFFANNLNGNRTVVSTPTSTTFTYNTTETPIYTNATGTGMTVTKVGSVANSVIPGPYTFDPDNGFDISSTSTTITQDLSTSLGYSIVGVANASGFADTQGWVVFGFGTSNVVGPVKYLGKLSDTQILIDGAFKFTANVPSGATVIALNQKGPLSPDNAAELGSFYITPSSSGRLAASEVLDDMVGAGFTIDKIIVYPGDRGLGAEGFPTEGANKLSDKVTTWGGDNYDADYAKAQAGE